MLFRIHCVGHCNVFQSVWSGDGYRFAVGITVYYIGYDRVCQISLYRNRRSAFADNVGNGYIPHTVGQILAVEIIVSQKNCTAVSSLDIWRCVDDAVYNYVIDIRHCGEETDGIAEVGVGDNVTNYYIVDIPLSLCPIVVHDVGGS